MLAASATWPTAELLLKFCKTDPNLKSWFAKTVSRYQTIRRGSRRIRAETRVFARDCAQLRLDRVHERPKMVQMRLE